MIAGKDALKTIREAGLCCGVRREALRWSTLAEALSGARSSQSGALIAQLHPGNPRCLRTGGEAGRQAQGTASPARDAFAAT